MIKNTRKQSGTVSVEYALMISLTAIGLIVAIGLMTNEMQNLFSSIKDSVQQIEATVTSQIDDLIFNIGKKAATEADEAAGLTGGDYVFNDDHNSATDAAGNTYTLGDHDSDAGTADTWAAD